MDYNPEKIFKENAQRMMIDYNHQAFSRDYRRLLRVILQSMEDYNQTLNLDIKLGKDFEPLTRPVEPENYQAWLYEDWGNIHDPVMMKYEEDFHEFKSAKTIREELTNNRTGFWGRMCAKKLQEVDKLTQENNALKLEVGSLRQTNDSNAKFIEELTKEKNELKDLKMVNIDDNT